MIVKKNICYFLSVIESGTIAQAAFDMNITPSAISHSIKNLEKALGFELFKKTNSGLILTAAGKIFHEDIMDPINRLNDALFRNKNLKSRNETLIKTDGIYYTKIIPILEEINKTHPRNITSVTTERVFNIQQELEKEFSDIIISTVNMKMTSDKIQKIQLSPEKVGILINEEKFEKYQQIKKMFKYETLIHSQSTLQHPTFKSLLIKLNDIGIDPKLRSINEMDLIDCVSKGMGFSICTEDMYKNWDLKNKNLLYIEKPFPFDCLIYRNAYFLNKRKNELSEMISALKVCG